jgi:hypothetical protein
MRLPVTLRRLQTSLIADVVTSGLRHEVRSKMQGIANASFFLQAQISSRTDLCSREPRVPRFFTLIEKQIESVRTELGKHHTPTPADAVPVPIGRLGEALAALVEPADRATLQLRAGRHEELAVRAHPDELLLALSCLLENALEALPPDGPREVALRAERQGAIVAIDVLDRGPGMTPEVRGRAIEPFFTDKPGHLGLGLEVARRIAQRWKGTLELLPLEPGGACARISLPAAASGAVLVEQGEEVLDVERLEQPGHDGRFAGDCARHVVVAAREDDHGDPGERRIAGLRGQELGAAHAGHEPVEQHEIDRSARGQGGERLRTVGGHHDVERPELQDLRKAVPEVRVVVDDQHPPHPATLAGATSVGRGMARVWNTGSIDLVRQAQ